MHLRVIKRMRNEGENKAYFLDSVLFLEGGGSWSGTLELYAMVGYLYLNVSISDHANGLRSNH
jgi:hypothetical protein